MNMHAEQLCGGANEVPVPFLLQVAINHHFLRRVAEPTIPQVHGCLPFAAPKEAQAALGATADVARQLAGGAHGGRLVPAGAGVARCCRERYKIYIGGDGEAPLGSMAGAPSRFCQRWHVRESGWQLGAGANEYACHEEMLALL